MSPRAFLAGALAAWAGVAPGTSASGPGRTAPDPDSSFVGSQTCRSCHATTHSSWTNGRHSRMLQEAGPKSVIPRFAGIETLRGKEYQLERDGDSFFIVERYLQDTPTRRRVDYTLGSRRVQHYLSRLDDGRIVVLPPSYDVEKKEWFHNLDIVDLEETGEVKVQVWNTNCFGCHVSGEQKGFDPAKKSFETTWTDFGTTCERCHGPGRAHATKYAARKKGEAEGTTVETRAILSPASTADRETAIVHPRRLDAETSTTLCAQCHSLRDITQPGFAGGSNYYDYFTPLLEYAQKRNRDPAYWPNGRPRRFSNEAVAFWESQCSFKGGATCLSCHTDAHEPDIDKNASLVAKQDALCAGCHPQIAGASSEHSRHTTPEATCVSCHMPRTSISLRHRMPDHTISLPAPENTIRFGIPNACNECHKDRKAAWAEAQLARWFPNGRRSQAVADAAAFSAGVKADPAGLAPLVKIAGDRTRPPLMRANALGHLRGYPDPTATSALLEGARESHPVIRLAALLSLADRGGDQAVRAAMQKALGDERRTVRMASALGLLNASVRPVGTDALSEGLRAAMRDHAERAAFLRDDPITQLDLGKMFFLAGDWKRAEASVHDALALSPRLAGGRYFLGLATLGQGRTEEGKALLRGVDRKDPHRKDADTILARLSGG
ncbi:MAG: HEAT repeat domain-containing protein [Vicinamibacteria bacterium]